MSSRARASVRHASALPEDRWHDRIRGDVRFRTVFSGHLTATDTLAAGLAELPPGGWLGLHRHPQTELYHVLAGRGVVSVDGCEHHVEQGSSVLVPGHTEHGARNTGSEPLRFLYVFAADSIEDVDYRFSADRSSPPDD
jgi:mannose-6-phosphate isomerase-like protein (cupin superfamily)